MGWPARCPSDSLFTIPILGEKWDGTEAILPIKTKIGESAPLRKSGWERPGREQKWKIGDDPDQQKKTLSPRGCRSSDIYGLDAASCRNRALREDLSVRKELQRLAIDCSGHIAKGLPRLVPWSGFERPDQSVRQKFFRHRSFWCGPHERLRPRSSELARLKSRFRISLLA